MKPDPSGIHPLWKSTLADKGFRTRYEEFAGKGPMYAIPNEILPSLGSILRPEAIRFERSFTQCCIATGCDVVGLWNGMDIRHNLISITNREAKVPNALIRKWKVKGKSIDEKVRFIDSIEALTRMYRRECQRFAGKLVTLAKYIDDVKRIRGLWQPVSSKAGFPLTRRHVVNCKDARYQAFANELSRFLDTWQLAALDTWHLPVPIGRYDAMPVRGIAALYPDAVIEYISPSHVAANKSPTRLKPGRIRLSKEEGATFRRALKERNLSTEEWVYSFRFAELAFRSRYGTPRGYRKALMKAFIAFSHLGEDRVCQIVQRYRSKLQREVG